MPNRIPTSTQQPKTKAQELEFSNKILKFPLASNRNRTSTHHVFHAQDHDYMHKNLQKRPKKKGTTRTKKLRLRLSRTACNEEPNPTDSTTQPNSNVTPHVHRNSTLTQSPHVPDSKTKAHQRIPRFTVELPTPKGSLCNEGTAPHQRDRMTQPTAPHQRDRRTQQTTPHQRKHDPAEQ
jgi:hypothetical protein